MTPIRLTARARSLSPPFFLSLFKREEKKRRGTRGREIEQKRANKLDGTTYTYTAHITTHSCLAAIEVDEPRDSTSMNIHVRLALSLSLSLCYIYRAVCIVRTLCPTERERVCSLRARMNVCIP